MPTTSFPLGEHAVLLPPPRCLDDIADLARKRDPIAARPRRDQRMQRLRQHNVDSWVFRRHSHPRRAQCTRSDAPPQPGADSTLFHPRAGPRHPGREDPERLRSLRLGAVHPVHAVERDAEGGAEPADARSASSVALVRHAKGSLVRRDRGTTRPLSQQRPGLRIMLSPETERLHDDYISRLTLFMHRVTIPP